VIFGAAAFSRATDETASEVLTVLQRFGVNHLDTAASYGDSEVRLAPWLATDRDAFFLATKTGERTADGARANLDRSLERLGVSSVDLIQLHNLVEDEEWETAFAKGGVIEGLIAARDEGLVRFIGVTGHGVRIPHMHCRSLERFDFDSVLFPYNFAMLSIPEYRRDVESLLAICSERNVAVQTIKSIARRRWTETPAVRRSWYEPIADHDAIGRAVHFVLGNDQLFLNSSSDYELLEPALHAALAGGPVPADADLEADVDAYGVTALFDGGALERI
jgi:aryl-alcohol dehydrogenase-like predicted oxidoreductase